MNRISLIELNKDKQIAFAERSNIKFTLKEEIGRGASCIVYYAVGSDNTEHLLKEYYPKHLDLTRDTSGQIIVPTDKADAYEQGLICFREGHSKQRELRRHDELRNRTCNIEGIYGNNGTEYVDMTYFTGKCYAEPDAQESSVYTLMLRMRALAEIIGAYHSRGYLHLDIKPQNIFALPEAEEMVLLFDFDSVVPLKAISEHQVLSCSREWAAPEQLLPEKRKNICPATDIFAIGEIIFVQLFGRHSTSAERRSFVTQYAYDHNAEIFKDMNPKVFALLDDLLCHTICGVVGNRYQSAEKLIAKLDEIIKIANPEAPYLKNSPLTVQDFFVGRDNEIAEIHRKLSANRILFLNGIGGIGKSELAKHYAEEHKDDYDAIIFAPYISNVSMLLLDDNAIPLYNFTPYPEEKPEDYCARKLKKLSELCDDRTLFIVDNLDCEDDPDLNKLLDLGCKFLVTTRRDFSGFGNAQIYVDKLESTKKIREIFDNYYKAQNEEESACIDEIITILEGHTMAVELVAKQIEAEWSTADEILMKLKESGVSGIGDSAVDSGKDGINSRSAFEHVKALFDLTVFRKNNNTDALYVLANLAVIPHTGIDRKIFAQWCELDRHGGKKVVNDLIKTGWVRQEKQTKAISLHAVVAEIVLDSCSDFSVLSRMVCRFNLDLTLWDGLVEEKKYAIQACSSRMIFVLSRYIIKFDWAVNLLKDLAEYFCQKRYDPRTALKAITAAIERADLLGNFDYESKLNLRGNYGVICDQMGEITQDDRWSRKAVEIYTRILKDHNITIMDYDFVAVIEQNLACAYDNLGDFENAFSHYQEALSVRIQAEPTERNNSEIALLFNNIGVMYRRRGNYKEACAYYERALELAKRIDARSERVAKIYHDIGCAILASGEKDLSLAIHYAEESLNIRNELWGAKTYYLAMSKSLLGELYIRAKCTEKNEYAVQLLKEALLVYNEVLRQDNSKTKKLAALLKSALNGGNL